MPVYFVIGEWVQNPHGYGLYRILRVIEGDFDPVHPAWPQELGQLQAEGRNVQVHLYEREPANPFRKQP